MYKYIFYFLLFVNINAFNHNHFFLSIHDPLIKSTITLASTKCALHFSNVTMIPNDAQCNLEKTIMFFSGFSFAHIFIN